MGKQHLVFDTTDANTMLDSDNVGAYVRAADGTLITKTTVGAKEALDVNIANASIAVTASDLDIRDLTAATDSVSSYLKDGAGTSITSTTVGGKQALDVRIAEGVSVEVDLSHTEDSVRLGDGTNYFTSTTVGADVGLDVNLINASIAVTASDLDIRDLTAATDSVSSYTKDGSGNAITSTTVGADVGLDVNILNTISVNDAALADTAIAAAANALAANTAEDVVASPLANRKYLFIYNNGNRTAFIGQSGVTVSNGYPIAPGSEAILRAGASVDIEVISAAIGEVRTLELA